MAGNDVRVNVDRLTVHGMSSARAGLVADALAARLRERLAGVTRDVRVDTIRVTDTRGTPEEIADRIIDRLLGGG